MSSHDAIAMVRGPLSYSSDGVMHMKMSQHHLHSPLCGIISQHPLHKRIPNRKLSMGSPFKNFQALRGVEGNGNETGPITAAKSHPAHQRQWRVGQKPTRSGAKPRRVLFKMVEPRVGSAKVNAQTIQELTDRWKTCEKEWKLRTMHALSSSFLAFAGAACVQKRRKRVRSPGATSDISRG